MSPEREYEVIVVGAGNAGLSAALSYGPGEASMSSRDLTGPRTEPTVTAE